MKVVTIGLTLFLFLTGPVGAGVVFEIEVTDHTGKAPRTEQNVASVEGRLLKLDSISGSSLRNSVVYRGDRRELLIINHGKKSYQVMDEETLQQVAGQLSAAQQELEKQLAGLPKEQREAMERMLKGRLPQAQPARAPAQVRNTGERSVQSGYPCVRYEVFRDGNRVRELWVTDWDNVEGGGEALGVFRDMAEFYRKLFENSPMAQSVDANLFSELDQLDGFPVVTRSFNDGGKLVNESQLQSSQRRALDPAEFEAPSGYKRQSMFPGR